MDIVFALRHDRLDERPPRRSQGENLGHRAPSATGQPTPELRVGLVAYRDNGDTYVTKVTDLTADLDKVYARLSSFSADGAATSPSTSSAAFTTPCACTGRTTPRP